MAAAAAGKHLWGGAVKQVTKTNFAAVLQQFKEHIKEADFIAVTSKKTGDFGSSSSHRYPWRRILPIDIPETAYLKAKLAAETFELLQFSVCPFRLHGAKVVAFPGVRSGFKGTLAHLELMEIPSTPIVFRRYNFHLFPRDEMNLGMPSYNFSCQTSFLTSLAQEGFDFNTCIYDGISYLSRVQESKAKIRSHVPHKRPMASSSNPTTADSIFIGRVKSRVEHWWRTCKDPEKTTDGPLVQSLRKLILGGQTYGSRPCVAVDVCSDRQVQLVFDTIAQICEDLVPLVVLDKEGEPTAVRVVLTTSEEDKNLLMTELQNIEEEHTLKVRGFREVIDVISDSHKPIIGYNCIHDFTFVHSKFLAPLPANLAEFMLSLRSAFSNIIDVNHLLKEVGPLQKAKNLPAAASYLKRQFFLPIEMEIPQQAEGNDSNYQGHKVLQLTHLFAKLSNLLKIVPGCEASARQQIVPIEDYANIFYPCCTSLQEPEDENVCFWMDNMKRISSENLVFLWGFTKGISSRKLKEHLQKAHPLFIQDFELQLVDKTCAVVVFSKPSSVEILLNDMVSGIIGSCTEIMPEGLKAAGYEVYRNVCRLGLWETDLAESLSKSLSGAYDHSADFGEAGSEVHWSSESMIYLDEL